MTLSASAASAAFDQGRYEQLVAYLNQRGMAIDAGTPISVDGAVIFPKAFRDGFAAFLGDGFADTRVRVAQGGRLVFETGEAEGIETTVALFDCRHPGFTYRWREAAETRPHSQVAVLTNHAACIRRNDVDSGELSWFVPKGRHEDIARALMLFREVFVRP